MRHTDAHAGSGQHAAWWMEWSPLDTTLPRLEVRITVTPWLSSAHGDTTCALRWQTAVAAQDDGQDARPAKLSVEAACARVMSCRNGRPGNPTQGIPEHTCLYLSRQMLEKLENTLPLRDTASRAKVLWSASSGQTTYSTVPRAPSSLLPQASAQPCYSAPLIITPALPYFRRLRNPPSAFSLSTG